MALWTLEKAPFTAIFHDFFEDFLRVFPRAFPSGRKLARIRPRKALVRVQTGAIEAVAVGSFEPCEDKTFRGRVLDQGVPVGLSTVVVVILHDICTDPEEAALRRSSFLGLRHVVFFCLPRRTMGFRGHHARVP
jgi:hypothetical protein